MALNREDIQKMPIKRLRLLDISDPADEAIVQALIKEKLAEQPIVGSPARAKPHATDNLTPETEAILQKQIDAQNASKKAHALADEVVEAPGPVAPLASELEAPLSHPADAQAEADAEAKLALLEAERAALVEAEKVPFVPEVKEEAPVVEPVVPVTKHTRKGGKK